MCSCNSRAQSLYRIRILCGSETIIGLECCYHGNIYSNFPQASFEEVTSVCYSALHSFPPHPHSARQERLPCSNSPPAGRVGQERAHLQRFLLPVNQCVNIRHLFLAGRRHHDPAARGENNIFGSVPPIRALPDHTLNLYSSPKEIWHLAALHTKQVGPAGPLQEGLHLGCTQYVNGKGGRAEQGHQQGVLSTPLGSINVVQPEKSFIFYPFDITYSRLFSPCYTTEKNSLIEL